MTQATNGDDNSGFNPVLDWKCQQFRHNVFKNPVLHLSYSHPENVMKGRMPVRRDIY